MRALLNKRTWAWLAVLLAMPALVLGAAIGPAAADPGTSGDDACTTGTYTGGVNDGTWTRNYNPNCDNDTKATVSVEWHNYVAPNGHHHLTWQAGLTTDQISGSKCVQIALDFTNPTGDHEDAQFLRNCRENSTVSLDNMNGTQNIDVYQPFYNVNWSLNRLQLGTYNPNNCDSSTCAVSDVVCPGANGAPPFNGGLSCGQWLSANGGASIWNSVVAKIYRKTNAGNNQQNDPTWPSNYDIDNLVSSIQ